MSVEPPYPHYPDRSSRDEEVRSQLARDPGPGTSPEPGAAAPDVGQVVDASQYQDPSAYDRAGEAPGGRPDAPAVGSPGVGDTAEGTGGGGDADAVPGGYYDRGRAHEDNLADGLDGRSRADDEDAAGIADKVLPGGTDVGDLDKLPRIFEPAKAPTSAPQGPGGPQQDPGGVPGAAASQPGAQQVPRAAPAGPPGGGSAQGGGGAAGLGAPEMGPKEREEGLEESGGWGSKVTAAVAGALMLPLVGLLVLGMLMFGMPALASISALDPAGGYRAVDKVSELLIEPDQLGALQDAAGRYDVPWPVLMSVSTLATENGKFSPYADDMIDRNLDRKGIRRPNAGETGPGVAGGGAAFTADGQIPLLGATTVTPDKMAAFVRSKRKDVTINLEELAVHFVTEGAVEGVKADVAWVQSILETTWFSFVGSRVEPSDHNYAGIGAYDSTNTNFGYPSPQMGARAQMQLLKLYADPNGINTLKNPLLTNTPVKGCCQTVMQLAGVWASDQTYGVKITQLYNEMLAFAGASPTVAPPGGVGPPAPAPAVPVPGVPDPAATPRPGKTTAPAELVPYGNGRIPTNLLKPVGNDGDLMWGPAADAFNRLLADASAQGISVTVTSGYRSYDEQAALVRQKGLYGKGGLAAAPGKSNHGWAVAIDVGYGPGALDWMRANAPRYGFFDVLRNASTPEDWHWEYQGGGSSGNVPAGGGGGVAYPPNPPGLEVSTYPQVTPPIGKETDPGVGPYLLVPRVVADGDVDAQRTGAGDDSAHAFVAEQLAVIRDRMYDEGWDVPGTDEAADKFWAEAVNRLPVADPRRAQSCTAPVITAAVGDQVNYRNQVAIAIGELWRCELDRAARLEVMTGPDTQASSVEASQLVVDEAMGVAWAFSGWGTAACDDGAELAGVFPITQDVFNAHAAPENVAAGRCAPAANIQAAAAAFAALEQVPVADRPDTGGRYSRMVGGWASMPFALGSADSQARFAAEGPTATTRVSVDCRAALDDAVSAAERVEGDGPASLAGIRADATVTSVCLGVDAAALDDALGDSLATRIGTLRSVDELVEGGVGDPGIADPVLDAPAPVDPGPAVTVAKPELEARANRLQEAVDAMAAAGAAPFTPGVDAAVRRLSASGRGPAGVPGAPVRLDPAADDWAKAVVTLAGHLGGTWVGDERAQKKEALDNALATIRQFWGVVGGTGASGQYGTAGIVVGNGSVSPDLCPTVAAPNTLRQGADVVGLAAICRASVLAAPTPQAAAAIINALGPEMLGTPYSQPRRNTPRSYDCSSYVSRAYRAAGVATHPSGQNAPVVSTFLGSLGWTRKISYAEMRPGDLVTTGVCTRCHVVMVLADGWMVHTNRTGDISHVKRLYPESGIAHIVRIVPEGAAPTPPGTPL